MKMHSIRLLARLIVAAGLLVTPAHAQDIAKQGAAPKPAPSASEAVLEQWNDIGRKLIAMAEDFPDDKYDFKPTPAVGTFAQRLIHAAHANEFFINALQGQKMPEMADPKRDQFKTKSDVVAFVKKSFAGWAAVIKAKGDKGMSDLVVVSVRQRTDANQRFRLRLRRAFRRDLRPAQRLLPRERLVPPESRPKK